MGQADRDARLLDACYRTYGVSASWAPVAGGDALTPTVRHVLEDVETRFGDSSALMRTNILFVRASEVPTPRKGDVVQIPAGTFKITVLPSAEMNGLEWRCEAAKA